MHLEPRLLVNESTFSREGHHAFLTNKFHANESRPWSYSINEWQLQRHALATRTIVLTLLRGVNLARRNLQPSQGSHQLGCGGVSLTRSHVYNFGFRLSLSSYCRLASPSVENLFLPVFRNSYLSSNNKYLLQ